MLVCRPRKGSWEWGQEILSEDGRAMAGFSVRSGGATARFWMGDERLEYSKHASLIVTPRGEVWLCDGRDLSLVFARKRLLPKLTSVRLRLFAAIPEASAGGGRVLAVWKRLSVRRVRLGIRKPPARSSEKN
jgi:hypothetical protein